VIALLLFLDLTAATTGAPEIVMPGVQFATGLPRSKTPSEWWAICGDELKPVTVMVTKAKDPDYDLDDVVPAECSKPVVLTRGVEGVARRRVLTVPTKDLEWGGRRVELKVSRGRLWMMAGTARHRLADSASSVKVLWAGDLDGDGELDLLLDVGDEEAGAYILFTSRGGIHEVARRRYSAC
jgi:hypothetical protein